MSLLNGVLALTSKKIHLPEKKRSQNQILSLHVNPHKAQLPQGKDIQLHYGNITEEGRHHAFAVILAQHGSQALIIWCKMQPFLCRKDDSANITFLSFMREVNMQEKLLLDTRTAPGFQPFKQLFRHLDFRRHLLRACESQKQHLNCTFSCMPTSEQG